MKAIARKLSLRKHNKQDSQASTSQAAAPDATTNRETPEAVSTANDNMTSSLPKTFKAAVLNGKNEPLVIKEIPMLEVNDGEILIKVHACGVCHSDAHVLHGDMGPM